MDEPDSAWTEDMGVSEMYEMALKCPCEEKTCVNILLRLRSCMRLKFEVDDAISALQSTMLYLFSVWAMMKKLLLFVIQYKHSVNLSPALIYIE